MAISGLNILAVSQQADFRTSLDAQLKQSEYVQEYKIVSTLADTVTEFQTTHPDLLIIDLTDCETDACLFIETINYNVENKTIVFGLHKKLEPSIIIRAVSSGIKEFIHYPDNAETLNLAIEKHYQFFSKVQSNKEAQSDDVQQGKIFGVFSPKGGSGASTVAANLAYNMTQLLGKDNVILFDLDQSYCNLTSLINAKIEYGLNDLEYNSPADFDEEILKRIIVKHSTGLDILLSCKSVMDDNPPVSEQLLVQVLEYLKNSYKAVIVDLPSHNVDIYHQMVASESEALLVISAMDIPSLYRGRQYLELAKQNMPEDQIKLIINRHDLKGCVGVSGDELETQYSHPIYSRLPNQWNINVEAISVGRFINELDTNNILSKSLHELAGNLLGVSNNGSPQDDEQRLTLLHKLPRDLFGGLRKSKNNQVGV